MTTDILAEQAELRSQLWAALNRLEFAFDETNVDIVIAHCEINDRHGVGVLLQRLFPDDRRIVSIRSRDLYDGWQKFGAFDLCLRSDQLSAAEISSTLAETLGKHKPGRILSVPYYVEDVLTTLAIKEKFDVPLCTYVMDDQNIYVNNIPDHCLKDLLQKSDLRLGISQDICLAYEEKYQLKFWFLPPMAPSQLIQTQSPPDAGKEDQARTGVLIGNIWSQGWLDQLRTLTRETGEVVHWYGNPNRDWLHFQDEDLQRDGIWFHGYAPEDQLIAALREAAYAVILTGTTDELADRPELAKLSLPSRIPYMVAVANIPMLVIGSQATAAARFVEKFQLGRVCEYDPDQFRSATAAIRSPLAQQDIRQRAARLATSFSSEGIGEWLWRSLEKGRPLNFQFEQLGTTLSDANVVVTACEMNQSHGTGPLVKRIVADTPNILSIRSMDLYGGDHDFGDVSLYVSHRELPRPQSVQQLLTAVDGHTLKRILCVPYRADDLITSIALHDRYNIPLATYIMDDQNICVNYIPDELMEEFLTKCSLRLATHPELRDVYEEKYGLNFWILPAVVPDALISTAPPLPDSATRPPMSGALIGSLWSPRWYEMLWTTVLDAGVELDWYGNTQYFWMTDTPEQMKQRGINPYGLLPEDQLAKTLSTYPYLIVPTGTLDDRDDHPELSRLSLPGRIIFAMATANIPIIVLGSEKTSASRFVQRFNIGLTCDYDGLSLKQAIQQVVDRTTQQQMRQNAANLASGFSTKGINQWLWNSLERGEPCDRRFEDLFSRTW